MTATMPPLVDEAGNIDLHGRSALYIPVKFREGGVYQDISEWALFFEVSGQFRVALAAGPDDYTRIIEAEWDYTEDVVPPSSANFALVNETPVYPVVPWSGVVKGYGYRTAPPGPAYVQGTGDQPPSVFVVVDE